jgi:hypothetical protein
MKKNPPAIQQKQKQAHAKNNTGVIPGTPLYKRSVVMKDCYELNGSPILGNGI